jgi:hypothetical protein
LKLFRSICSAELSQVRLTKAALAKRRFPTPIAVFKKNYRILNSQTGNGSRQEATKGQLFPTPIKSKIARARSASQMKSWDKEVEDGDEFDGRPEGHDSPDADC